MAVGRGGIPPEILQQIRHGADITEVVARYVTLTKTGQNHKGLCPFHSEKTPSFTASSSKQMFYCFGCGAGGDVITFLMKKEGMEFPEAVHELAKQTGITIPVIPGKNHQYGESENRKKLDNLHNAAKDWFRKNLLGSALGQPARNYLDGRQIHPDAIEKFRLGYAPPGWDGLTRHLKKIGVSPDDIVQSGLAVAKNSGSRGAIGGHGYYDRFRSRVMFPIVNLRDQVVAFGGRIFGEGEPKYLNSPETLLFRKSRCLFGFDHAREAVSRLKTILLVEGYFDVIVLHQYGFTHSVAPLGTALTKDHVDMIRRFVQTVVLVFDGDSAGVEATLRTLDVLKDSGITVKVAVLPTGDDPDSFVRTKGAEAFALLQDQAVSLLDFVVDQYVKRTKVENMNDRVRCVDEVLRVIQNVRNPIEKEEYTRQVSERLGIRQQLLVERYQTLTGPLPRQEGSLAKSSSPTPRKLDSADKREEKVLISLLIQGLLSPEQIQALHVEQFTTPTYRQIMEMGLRHTSAEGQLSLDEFHAEIATSSELEAVTAELSLTSHHFDDQQAYIQGCLEMLERKWLQATLEGLIIKLRAAERDNRTEDIRYLNAKIDSLREKKAVFAASLLTQR